MGQKVRPTGFRTGIMIDPLSSWYANKQDFSELLLEDFQIRQYIKKRFRRPNSTQRPGIARVRIERTRDKVTIQIYTSRPGTIIGKKGTEIDKLIQQLEHRFTRKFEVKTIEIGRPEVEPQLVAEDIAEQLERRMSFRRTMKKAIDTTMDNGAKGIRVQLAGRLGGAEMARTEIAMAGSIPLSTLRAKVDYGFAEASTAQGNIGIKVWINNGEYGQEEADDATNAQARQVPKKPTRQSKR